MHGVYICAHRCTCVHMHAVMPYLVIWHVLPRLCSHACSIGIAMGVVNALQMFNGLKECIHMSTKQAILRLGGATCSRARSVGAPLEIKAMDVCEYKPGLYGWKHII